MKFTYILFVTLCFTVYVCAKVYDRYELAQELYNAGVTNITIMTCITARQSNYVTDHVFQGVGERRGYGIFQFYYPYWCDEKESGKGCNIKCDKLIDDDLSDDIQCLKVLLRQQGIEAFAESFTECAKMDSSNVPDWVWISKEKTEHKTTETKRCPPRRDRNRARV